MRELSLLFASFVEREEKAAGSQVTVKMLLACSDAGRIMHCSVWQDVGCEFWEMRNLF